MGDLSIPNNNDRDINYLTIFLICNTVQPKSAEVAQTDWIGHTSAGGRRDVIVIATTGPIHLFVLLFV